MSNNVFIAKVRSFFFNTPCTVKRPSAVTRNILNITWKIIPTFQLEITVTSRSAKLILIKLQNYTNPALFINIPIPLIIKVKQPVHTQRVTYMKGHEMSSESLLKSQYTLCNILWNDSRWYFTLQLAPLYPCSTQTASHVMCGQNEIHTKLKQSLHVPNCLRNSHLESPDTKLQALSLLRNNGSTIIISCKLTCH